jgi:uncharacterized protein (TIGR03435 family)
MSMVKSARSKRILGSAILLLLLPALSFGQTPLSFEVASIKPAEPLNPAAIAAGKIPRLGMQVDGARVDIGFLSLGDLISTAFKLKPYQVIGPEWMRQQRFDISAKLPDGATKEQVPEMLQALLQERFGLKAHKENRESNVYALIVAKGGHKLKEAEPDPATPPSATVPGTVTFGAGENQIRVNAGRGGATVTTAQTGTTKITPGPDGTMRMEIGKVTMAAFAEMLTPLLDRPVVDMTEVKGTYQVALDLSLDTLMNVARAAGVGVPGLGARGADPSRPADASDPGSSNSILNSVQQLGLRLESRKAPVEFVVVDQVEKTPTEN